MSNIDNSHGLARRRPDIPKTPRTCLRQYARRRLRPAEGTRSLDERLENKAVLDEAVVAHIGIAMEGYVSAPVEY
jgi:hypothetical protein